jgi:choline dehydrogenase
MTDYIVVGGGSAGCVVAARLTEDKDVAVTLLEDGPRDTSPFIHLPVTYYKTSQGNLVKRYPWEPPESYLGSPSPTMIQARILGGGSSVNGLVYVRGLPADYDSWQSSGATGWSYNDVLPYFRRCESNDRLSNESHGTSGPLAVSDQQFTHFLTKKWLQACQQSGLSYNHDFNSGVQDGCGLYQITTRNGRRSSTAVAYLRPARGRRNLTVRTNCRVLKVLLENGRAVGVAYEHKGRVRTLRAVREVILCAGTINSPKLLLLSGIGPADQLCAHGLTVACDLPGVGRNLQDHLEVSLLSELRGPVSYDKYKRWHWQAAAGLQYLLFGSGPAVSNLVEGAAFWRSSLARGQPDVQYCFLPGAGLEGGVDTVPNGNGFTMNVCPTRPDSVGSVELRSSDPMDFPLIKPNYLGCANDVERFIEAVEHAREILSQPAISGYVTREYVPDVPLRTREDYRQFVRRQAHAALHPVGTCRIGMDATAVVQPDLRVHGVPGLRVADASVMPNLCSGNTNAAAIMIGEKGSDHIRGLI